jgi:hypothetical protein
MRRIGVQVPLAADLRKRPRAPSKGRGPVQRAIRRAFAASGADALTSSAIYDWAHVRRRLGRCKSMPFSRGAIGVIAPGADEIVFSSVRRFTPSACREVRRVAA